MVQKILFWVLFSLATCSAVPLENNLVRFYPISREQYDSILSMTAGQPLISEGTLKSSSFLISNNFPRDIKSDISSDWQELLGMTSVRPLDSQNTHLKVDGYPLCVIKTNDKDEEQTEGVDTNLQKARGTAYKDGKDQFARNVGKDDYEDNDSKPVVHCIVVVKNPEESKTPYTQAKQQDQPQKPKNQRKNVSYKNHGRFRRPVFRSPTPYFYPPYPVHPGYPLNDYSNYPEARHSTAKNSPTSQYLNHPRSATTSTLRRAETTKPKMEDKSVGRSGYSGYYPGGPYGNYGNNAYSNYPQQYYPYNAGYGGCQNSLNPYGQSYYGGSYYDRSGDDESGEESDFSGEVGGEIGGHEF